MERRGGSASVFVRMFVRAGREESWMLRRFPAPAAGWVATDLALQRWPWGSGIVPDVEIPAEPRNA